MKIFIDSANLAEIKEAVSWGIIEGATTNPTLMAKEKNQSLKKISQEICRIVPGPVSLEGNASQAEEIIKEAKILAKIANNVVVKIPMTIEGIKAVIKLNKEGIKTNVTLVFSANQALIAAKAKATYVSPFLGRLDDIGQSGLLLIEEIKKIYKNYQFNTKIIAASIRNPDHVKQVALIGCDIATIPFKVLKQLYQHSLTDKGIALFQADWNKLKI
ncbi:MAG: fructose-6-phosphate aldolase [Microgenomates group bacterium]|nr:fructose-6-phosphate aldolase [Microgenomates group bacterium]